MSSRRDLCLELIKNILVLLYFRMMFSIRLFNKQFICQTSISKKMYLGIGYMPKSYLKKAKRFFLEEKVSLHVAVVLCILTAIIVWSLTLYSFKVVIGEVRIKGIGVGVYWDENCDNPIDLINWGKIIVNPLKPYAYKNVTVYVRNEGSYPIFIKLNMLNLNPSSLEKYIHITWDYNGEVLNAKESVKVTLSLRINSNIWMELPRIDKFSFNLIVSAKRV